MTNVIFKISGQKGGLKKKSDIQFLFFLLVAFQQSTFGHLMLAICPLLSETQDTDCLLNTIFR